MSPRNKRITQEELKSYLWNSAVLLRTHIDAGAYKQYIFPLLFFKRICDVYDEECVSVVENRSLFNRRTGDGSERRGVCPR